MPARKPCSPGARKARTHRQRQALGLVAYRLVLPEFDIVSYLIDTARLTPGEALNRLAVERAAADTLVDLARRWREANS